MPVKTDETICATLAKAAAELDEILASSIDNTMDILVRHGATDEELARELAIAENEIETARAKALAKLRAWLQRGGEPLQ
jgi:DNA-directed RNA polymerase sigma subunit (sigma70/sigma32)